MYWILTKEVLKEIPVEIPGERSLISKRKNMLCKAFTRWGLANSMKTGKWLVGLTLALNAVMGLGPTLVILSLPLLLYILTFPYPR